MPSPGDLLILTKPVGSGVMTKAVSMKLMDVAQLDETIKVMSSLNKEAARIMSHYNVNACTDITGFGLIGHLHEITQASAVDAAVAL
jgi:selenophosphate synthase